MDFESLVDDHYDVLTPTERSLARDISASRGRLASLSSTEAARELGVSRATLSRFISKLGFSRFAEFKVLISSGPGAILNSDQAFDDTDIAKGYRALVTELFRRDYRPACNLVHSSGTVYLYGSGNEQKAVAQAFRQVLLSLGKPAICLFDVGEVDFARQRFDPHDLLIAISLSGEGGEALRFVRHAQASGISTLSLTRWENNSLARLCDESIYVGTRTLSPAKDEGYEMVAAFYIVLDVFAARYIAMFDGAELERA